MIIIAIIILISFFLMFIFLIFAIISFFKRKILLGFSFVGLIILIPTILYLISLALEESTKPTSLSKFEIKTALSLVNIKLKNDFTVIDSNAQSDLYYFRNEFKLKISEEDYKRLKKNKSDTLKNIAKKNGLTYDTIKIILTKEKNLDFYRSQHDFNN